MLLNFTLGLIDKYEEFSRSKIARYLLEELEYKINYFVIFQKSLWSVWFRIIFYSEEFRYNVLCSAALLFFAYCHSIGLLSCRVVNVGC